jgi:hypothetical protein
MNNNQQKKLKIIQAIVKHIPLEINYDLSGRRTSYDLLSAWWYTGRGSGFRLTQEGKYAFELAEIEYYEYPVKISTSYNAFVLDLSKKLSCPYYLDIGLTTIITKGTVRLYDSRVAMMVSLYGSLMEYLDTIKIPSDRN